MMERFVTALGGIAGFGVISICLFVVVFTGALIWAFFQKKSVMTAMEALPLEEDDARASQKGDHHA